MSSSILPSELSEQLININHSRSFVHDQLNALSQHHALNNDSFQSITTDIKLELIRLDSRLDQFEILADECEDDRTRLSALQIVEENRKEVVRLRSSLRTVSLDAKRRLSAAELNASRAELLRGASTQPPPRSSNPDEALMSASSDVAQSLRNTLEIMKQELDRSVLSTHMLEQQTATLQLTSERYSAFGELLQTSRALITALRRADLLDRLLLSGALLVFILVCLHILKRRIFDRGLSLLSAAVAPFSPSKTVVTQAPDGVLSASVALATASAAVLLPGLAPREQPVRNPSVQGLNKPPLEPIPITDGSPPTIQASPIDLAPAASPEIAAHSEAFQDVVELLDPSLTADKTLLGKDTSNEITSEMPPDMSANPLSARKPEPRDPLPIAVKTQASNDLRAIEVTDDTNSEPSGLHLETLLTSDTIHEEL